MEYSSLRTDYFRSAGRRSLWPCNFGCQCSSRAIRCDWQLRNSRARGKGRFKCHLGLRMRTAGSQPGDLAHPPGRWPIAQEVLPDARRPFFQGGSRDHGGWYSLPEIL